MNVPKIFKPTHKTYKPTKQFNGRKHIDDMYWNSNWDRYRTEFIKTNPRCYACGVPATVVDHLVPHEGDKTLFEKLDNHIPLCAKCHNTITGLFDRKHTPGKSIDPKLKWMASMRSRLQLTHRVKVMPSYPGLSLSEA